MTTQDKPSSSDQDNSSERAPRSSRGFASMNPERQRQIASEGGKAAHARGKAHKFTSEEAREAGRKGGQASGGQRRKS